jgi:hypothetical protein
MAYGVKYRLEFSDDLENGKKIEIWKNNYSGTVYDLVGAAEPCVITWQGDDNFYEPIRGSECKINLFETDDTNYDNFYEEDEREYQVKVFYKDTSNNYQLFWIGWLVTDSFREAVTTKPFPITLTALDGLGTLSGFDMPLSTTSSSIQTGRYYITECLNNLDLELDIYVSQDIFIRNPGSTIYSVYDIMNITPYNLQKEKLDINDAKHTLEQILKITNARIFQSYGRWYIINNSSYSDQAVKDASSSTAQGGTIPTGIRASEASSLVTNGTELPKFVIYNYQGTYQSTSNIDVLYKLPANLTPLENSLTKEYLRPLKRFNITHQVSQYLKTNFTVLQNSGFENGLANWSTYTSTSTTSPGALSSEFSKQGNNSFKNDQTQTSTNTRKTLSYSQGYGATNNPNRGHTLKINSYFESTSSYSSTTEFSFRWQVRIEDETPIPPTDPTYYWNNSSESWTTTATINTQVADNADAWEEFSYDLGSFPYTGTLYIDLYEPRTSVSGHLEAIYYDNITMNMDIKDGDKRTPLFAEIDGFQYSRIKTSSGDTGVLELTDLQLSSNDYRNTNIFQAIRPRDDNASFVKSLEQIISQQVINDYRTNSIRYEGKLYNLENKPMGLHNKIWIDFGATILREPVSCILDSMTYNVKRNSYEVIMHIPNQDDDQASTFKVKF